MWNWPEHMIPPQTTFPLIYPAEVVDNVDPDNGASGRVQVRVWPMMRGISEDVLPWAAPAFGLFEGGMSDGGAFTVPNENARVYVFFAAGDVRSPIYFAAAPSATDGPASGTRDADLKVWKTRSGHLIEIDDESGEERIAVTTQGGHKVELKDKAGEETVELLHSVGHVIKLDKDGNIEITNDGATNVKLGKGTLRELLNTLAATLFNAHVHEYGAYIAGAPAPTAFKTSVPNDPALPPVADILLVPTGTPKGMGAAHETSDTKAS